MGKQYLVVAPYVTMTTMTAQGPRLLGFHTNAPVPPDVPEDQIKHHLEMGLIVEVADPAAVSAEVTPIERMEGVSPADKVREQEAALNRSRSATKAAETRKANEESDAAKADADAKASEAAKAKPVGLTDSGKGADAVVGGPVARPGPRAGK